MTFMRAVGRYEELKTGSGTVNIVYLGEFASEGSWRVRVHEVRTQLPAPQVTWGERRTTGKDKDSHEEA